MELIKELGQWTREHDEDILAAFATQSMTALELFEKMGFPMASRNWPAFWDIFNRPYWTRVWIIQELASSGSLLSAKGSLFCGKTSVDRQSFDYTCSIMIAIITLGKSVKAGSRVMEEPLK